MSCRRSYPSGSEARFCPVALHHKLRHACHEGPVDAGVCEGLKGERRQDVAFFDEVRHISLRGGALMGVRGCESLRNDGSIDPPGISSVCGQNEKWGGSRGLTCQTAHILLTNSAEQPSLGTRKRCAEFGNPRGSWVLRVPESAESAESSHGWIRSQQVANRRLPGRLVSEGPTLFHANWTLLGP